MSDNWWESDPVVSSPTADAWWANDPVVEQKKKEEEKKQTLVGMLPKWIGAPLDTAATLASGMVAPIASGYAGLAGAMLPGPAGQGADWERQVSDALSHRPETGLARGAEAVLGYPGAKLAQAGQWAGNKVEDITGSPLAATGVDTAIQALPMMLPYGLKKAFPEAGVAGSEASRMAEQAAGAQADANAAAAQSAGFKLPPTQVNPGNIPISVLEGLSGKANVARRASLNNQPIAQDLIRQDFGLPNDAPLTRATFEDVRAEAGKVYEAVRNSMYAPVRVSTDYSQALAEVALPAQQLAAAYPKAPPPAILKDIAALNEPMIDAGTAIDKIRELRTNAAKAYAAKDSSLGAQYTKLAGIVEDELAKNLPPDLLQQFQEARQTIAKSYTMQRYIRPSGEVDAVALANALKSGTPLEGGMLDVANLGRQFPKAAQVPSTMGGAPVSSAFDALIGLGSGLKAGSALGGLGGAAVGAGVGALRPLTAAALAGPYQRFLSPPSYGPSMGNYAMSAAQSPTIGTGLSALGLESEDEKRRKMLAQILGGY